MLSLRAPVGALFLVFGFAAVPFVSAATVIHAGHLFDTANGTVLEQQSVVIEKDNTLRVFSVEPTDWILSVTQMSGFRAGVAMGVTHQFTQDGQLLSTSSQTGLLPRR